jgi:hypothetical protein
MEEKGESEVAVAIGQRNPLSGAYYVYTKISIIVLNSLR